MKHQYSSFEKYIDLSNQKLIKKLKFNKRYKSFHGNKIENSRLIVNSDLVLSINSLSIPAKALLNDTESLNLCNLSIDKNFLKKINNLHPFVYYDLNEFEINFYKKLNFKNQNYKIKKFFL